MLDIKIIEDALFSAIAAIGFASISHLPRRAYIYCAMIAALGHSLRYILMNCLSTPVHIVGASLIAALFVGTLSVFLSTLAKTPAEACFFPALLPMIPGIYAYKALAGFAACILSESEQSFNFYFYQCASNGMVCVAVIACMVLGATLPIFIFKKVSFRATR